jgi:ABC-type sugar transport system substrate-binding protein
MLSPNDPFVARQRAAARLVSDATSGRLGRRAFLKRGAALGLSAGLMGTVLAACGDDDSDVGAAATTTAGGGGGGSDLSAISALVYPEGFTSDDQYNGPNGGSKVAFLPADAYGAVDDEGIPRWDFTTWQADQPYRLAFAHFSAAWDLSVEMTARFQRTAERLGCELDFFDNNFDANQAITNADLIAEGGYDYAIWAQIFPDANTTIERKMRDAGIRTNYLAVGTSEELGATFTDPHNFRMCFQLGEWLGQYAADNWDGNVDLVVLAAQPRAGDYVGEREVGYIAGIRSILPDLGDDVFVTIDSEGLLESAQNRTADALTSRSGATNILGCGTNDDAGVGVVRALEAAGLAETSAVAGQAGQASAVEELSRGDSAFKVSAFQDIESWTWMAAIGILELMGGEIAPANFVPSYLVTADNVADFPPQAGTLT